MSNELKKIVNHAAKYGVLVIFINQVRDKIGVCFGNPESTTGGRALKFNASIRLRLGGGKSQENDIKMKDENGEEVLMGRKATVSLAKNRFAKPYRGDPIPINIWYEKYFPNVEDMIFNEARKLKIITVYKKEFRWKDGDIGVEGKDEFMKAVKMKGVMAQLITAIAFGAKTENVILPPELTQAIQEKVEAGELPEDVLPSVPEATDEDLPETLEHDEDTAEQTEDSEDDDGDGDDVEESTVGVGASEDSD
jgi:RecA/RadA recombinase